MATSDPTVDGLTGLTGWMADVISASGEPGVALLTFIETVFPPIPSEIVLPLAGYLAQLGRLNLLGVLIAATIGSVLGATVLYGVGLLFGERRAATLMAILPLIDREDVEEAIVWFHRHGGKAVFFGRLVPGVRSLVSLPAGAEHMPLPRFLLLTAAGSGIWNAFLVLGGAALGTQYERVEKYAGLMDYVLIAAVVIGLGFLIRRRVMKVRAARAADASS